MFRHCGEAQNLVTKRLNWVSEKEYFLSRSRDTVLWRSPVGANPLRELLGLGARRQAQEWYVPEVIRPEC